MLEPKRVKVNGREYMITMFDPMTAFDFFLDLQNARENGKPHNHLARQAVNQCRTPDMGKELSDPAVFQEHFAKYPEDMLPLMREAMDALCAPFVKKQENTSKSGKG